MAVRNSDNAEDVAKSFMSKKWSWSDKQVETERVDFDGNFFTVEGAIKNEENVDEVIAHFSVKVDKERNVVGWKVTWA